MTWMIAKRLAAVAACCATMAAARAAAPFPAATQFVAASTAAAPAQETFTIATAEDLVVTLTDLQIPAPLVSGGVVVTQGGAIAGSGQFANPATNASVSLPMASGVYSLTVFGVPNASYSVGTFSLCVAPATAPSNCIQNVTVGTTTQTVSFAGNIAAANTQKDPTVSTLATPLYITTAGAYTFNYSDLAFPTALNAAANLALFQGSQAIIPPGQTSPGIPSGTTLTLGAGIYELLSIAQADQTVRQGLYSITVAGAAGAAPLIDEAVPVGLLGAATLCPNPSAQNLTLSVADYAFPGPLASASALLTSGSAALGTASAAGGAQVIAAPAGTLDLWTYGSPGSTPGTFSADVSSSGADICTIPQAVNPAGTAYAFAYLVPAPTPGAGGVATYTPLTAGAYTATAADLQFPSQLGSLAFAVAQGGVILQQSTTPTTLNFTAAAGNAILLVSAVAPTSATSPNGLFDVNVQSAGASASLVFDKTQSVSATPNLFSAQTVSVSTSESYDVSLTDLKFPAAFDSLALVVSRGSQVLGKVFGSGTVSFAGSSGTYQLTFVATPSADQQFGLYSESVVPSPPTVSLTSSVASAATGASITLTSSATNASSCSATGGWTGSQPTTQTMTMETLSATTTYTLTCTGDGGSGSQSVTVTATAPAASASHGGGGSLDYAWIIGLSGLITARWRQLKRRSSTRR